jgi:hypothetical protein
MSHAAPEILLRMDLRIVTSPDGTAIAFETFGGEPT